MSWIQERKWSVNRGLRQFSKWFDDFLLEVAKPLAIVGFAMGTVDIFTRGGIATDPWFNVPWAVVQATTIDGLFFAVWYRIFETKWKWAELGTNLLLVLIGLILGLVAMITNGILSLQQLRGTSDSLQAMEWLGIDPITFTIGRAVLVVFVSVMVAFVYHQRGGAQPTLAVNPLVASRDKVVQLPEQPAQPYAVVVQGEQWGTDWDRLLNNYLNNVHNYVNNECAWTEHGAQVSVQGCTAIVQETVQGEQPLRLIAERSEDSEQNDREILVKVFEVFKQTKRPINLREVARDTGIAYQRVRRLAPAIKKEVGV